MRIGIVSLFPGMFEAISAFGITGRAIAGGLVTLEYWNPRDFAGDAHQTVDARPYGGGPGMLMTVQPLKDAIVAAKGELSTPVIYLSPQGRQVNQATLARLADEKELVLVAGRYEGIDERLIESVVDEELSIGDFVVSGGELPAMMLIDGMIRLLPGAVGDMESVRQDSFSGGNYPLLDYPQYTRPEVVDGQQVPRVLLTGDHQAIEHWRKVQALGRTWERRPELLARLGLSPQDQALLDEYLGQVGDES